MPTVDVSTYQSIADMTLWFKYRNGDELFLSDIPKIVPLRWNYFRDNWEFIKPQLIERARTYTEPDYLEVQIKDMTDFIDSQRASIKKVNPFSDSSIFYKFYGIFDAVEINSIETTNEENRLIDEALNRVSQFNKNDFVRMRAAALKARDRIADEIGLIDEDYNRVYNRSSVPKQVDGTIADLTRMQLLQNQINSIDFVLANIFSLDTSFVDPFALARVNANNPDFNISQYKSGRLVRFNYGEDLQLLARKYLGDPDKWIDIAIANGLKPPYIDEVGERIPLRANGDGNQLNINGTDAGGELNIDKLFINQVIFLQSDTEKFPEQRIIINITQVPVSGEIILELNGAPDLERYKISENGHIRVFKPNTINSSFYILIPSEQALPDDLEQDVPFFLASASESEKRAKVDFALSDDGELLFSSTGDAQLSFGLANAVQALKLKLVTELGTLRRHPEYGLVNILGSTNNDIEQLRNLLVESINEQINLDPRFERVENLEVRYLVNASAEGTPAFLIKMNVRLAGSESVIPISFTVTV